jgi:hypothetical protein
MDITEVSRLLRENKVEVDMLDRRDAIDIGIDLELIGLRHISNEMSGSFDRVDIANMRRGGLVVRTVAFGQAVFEAVPAKVLEKEMKKDIV